MANDLRDNFKLIYVRCTKFMLLFSPNAFVFQTSQRPYHVENIGSRPITEVKQNWAWLVLGWVTAWEHHLLLATLYFFRDKLREHALVEGVVWPPPGGLLDAEGVSPGFRGVRREGAQTQGRRGAQSTTSSAQLNCNQNKVRL